MDEKWKKTALLVIDMQNDFILSGGPMLVAGGAAIVPNVVKAVEIARQRGILVIWVVREHDPLGRDVELFRRHHYSSEKRGPTAKGSVGSELAEGLVICQGDYKLVKTRFSAFFATHLHSLLRTAGIDSLVVTGVQTPNCIRQTVFDAVALDFSSVSVIVDATAAATPEVHAERLMGEEMKKSALLVIDMQNDCVLADGPVPVAGGAAIVPNVVKAVEIARQRGNLVIWVVREHDPSGRDVELFRRHYYSAGKTGPVIKGSFGSELVEGLVIRQGDYKLVKTRFSAFFATNLNSLLRADGIDSLVVTGIQTPNCIRQTVFDAVALDFSSVTVIVDATAAETPEVHAANIFDMKNIGVATPTLDEWMNAD